MRQQELFPNLIPSCPAEDDNGTKCTHAMTEKEFEQDGMCSRCADGIWHSMRTNTPFYFKEKQ